MQLRLASFLLVASVLIGGFAYRVVASGRNPAMATRNACGTTHVAVTKPSRSVRLGGARAGRIARIMVEPGATVRQGQILFELENEVERLEFERLKLNASSTATLDLALARLEKAEAEAERVSVLVERDITSGAREIEAVADRRIAEAEVAKARELQAMLALERDQAHARFELLRGRSPFNGRVEQLRHEVGESIDHLEPVLDLVVLDPLHVEFPCPLDQLPDWQPGVIAEVRSADVDAPGQAIVLFCGRQTDVASQTVVVRLELPNEDGRWLAGQRVEIRRVERSEGK